MDNIPFTPILQKQPHWKDDIWFILLILIFIYCVIALWSNVGAEEYPICKSFDSSIETFGEHKWKEHISGQDYIHEFNIPDWDTLIPIIIQIESSGNPYAVSKDGCIGLMQISPIIFKEYQDNRKPPPPNTILLSEWTFNNMFNPYSNMEIGTWYLKRIWFHYLPHYKIPQTIENLLIAYNFGIGNLVKYKQGKVKLPDETKEYIKKFWRLYK